MGRNADGILDEAGVLEKIIKSLETADAMIASCYRHQPSCAMIDVVRDGLARESRKVLRELTAVAGAGDPFVQARHDGGHYKAVAVGAFVGTREEALNPPRALTPERRARIEREIAEIEAHEAAAAEAAKVAEAARRNEERLAKRREAARLKNAEQREKRAELKKRRLEMIAERSGPNR